MLKSILLLAVAAAFVLSASAADARKRHKTYRSHPARTHVEPRPPVRPYADPSFGNREGINRAYGTGRCVQDLGYGRYKYCGW